MKRLFVVTLMVLMSLAVAAQTTHLKFTQNNEFASLNQSPGTLGGNSSFSLQVARTGASGTTTTATISYLEFAFAPDFSSFSFIQIQGAIPAAAFTGQTVNDLALSFDTSQLDPTTSVSQQCTFVFTPTPSSSCSAPATGLLSVEWKNNGVVVSKTALIQDQTLGPLTTSVHQHSDNTSASAQGTVFGLTVNPSSAQVGVNHSSTMEITRN